MQKYTVKIIFFISLAALAFPFSALALRAPVYQYQIDTVIVNDPGFTVNAQDIDKEWGLIKAGFPNAWSQTTGSASTTVAVIDTGVDATHQDLQAMNLVDGYDFINNKPLSGRIDSDDNGHGTLVTGVLAATANNGVGIVGTNWHISIMPIKALDSTGKGDSNTISQAIMWATDHGAKIINLSFGGIGLDHDTTLSAAISYAFNKGVLIVAAAGNDVAKTGGNLDQNPVFPVCDDNGSNMVLGVAATDQNDVKADFSNYGKGCIDIDAPGVRILSTINFDPVTHQPAPNSYAYGSGTSLAAPFVSGEAALIWALHPNLTNAQVRDIIISSATNIDGLNLSQCNGSCAGLLGSGRINAEQALGIATTSPAIADGELVEGPGSTQVYEILGGQKRPVSPFVQNQRFPGILPQAVSQQQLAGFPTGPYAVPTDGTLVKDNGDNTVFIISQGQKLPISAQVFNQRKMSFSSINTVSYTELNSWVTGSFLPPLDGTVLKAAKNRTVFWVVGQALHPVNYNFYLYDGLNKFPLMVVPDADFSSYPQGSAYIR